MLVFLENRTYEQMRKEAIICKLFEFGGTNAHLKTLLHYLGPDQAILIVEEESELKYLNNIRGPGNVQAVVLKGLHPYAHLSYSSNLSNAKEAFNILRSLIRILFFCIRHHTSGLTISTAEPEKYLYLFWIPFIRVRYVVHSTPQHRFTYFTSLTCNRRLSNRKLIITVSKANKQALCEAWRIKEAKARFVTVIYNCVAEGRAGNENYPDVASPVRNIITMGHVVSYKNPQVWIRVAKTITERLKDVQFTWLGNGPLLEEMRKEAESFNIYFTGLIEDPVPYLENAAIYYQPSLHETHGIAVIEAMSHHLPCVVSQTGGLPESVENNVNGILVPPEDADQHIAAIEKLIANPALALEYGTNGYQKYKDLFSFEKFKSEMDNIYLS